ncbi:MAG TPA: helix-turn-helix transcriptional regulator [Candidatus Kapabacteria bacterium]|nr:helix-turn-helix transcriptional regulator [Candidatus Kapabacteria bacterium]
MKAKMKATNKEEDKDLNKKPEDFAWRLRAIRKTLQLRQSDFADRLKVSGPALSEIENGKYKPGYDFIYNLVKEFQVNLYYLLFGEGEMFRDPLGSYGNRAGKLSVNAPDIRNFLENFERSPFVQYSVLAHFRSLMLRDREIIEQDIIKAEAEREALKNTPAGGQTFEKV